MIRRDRLGALLAVALLAGACDAAAAPSRSPGPDGSGLAASTLPPTDAPASVSSPAPTTVADPVGRIAFRRATGDGASQAFIVDVDGSDEVQLTHEAGSVDHLVWAPDGSRLYFQSIESRGCGETMCYANHLVSVRPDGSDRMDLGQVGATSIGVLSPDRRHLAYPTGEGYTDDFTDSFQIGALVVDLLTGTVLSLKVAATAVVWSPDSRRLLGADGSGVLVIDAQSAAIQLRIDDPWVEPDSPVGWSADGGSIFYHRCAPELNKDEVMACMAGPSWVVDLADRNLVPRPNAGPEPPKGALAPDGRWRAAFMDRETEIGLYLTPAGGGERLLLARLEPDAGIYDHLPSWSSDGAWLAIGIPDGIHIVHVAGGEPRFVAIGAAPAWQPTTE